MPDLKTNSSKVTATIKWLKPKVVETGNLPQGWRLNSYDVTVSDEKNANYFNKMDILPDTLQITIQHQLLLGSKYIVTVKAVYRNLQEDKINSRIAERIVFTGNIIISLNILILQ